MPTATTFIRPPWALPSAMSSVLVEAPSEEPLTLDEGKLRAGLDWPANDPRDAMMLGFISAARSQVEQDTGLALLTQTRDVTLYATITSGIFPLPPQALPVQSITTPTGYTIAAASWGDWWADAPIPIAPGTWRIVAGWPTADALKAEAPLLVQAVGLLTAHYATLGRDLAYEGRAIIPMPQGYDQMIAPYIQVWLT